MTTIVSQKADACFLKYDSVFIRFNNDEFKIVINNVNVIGIYKTLGSVNNAFSKLVEAINRGDSLFRLPYDNATPYYKNGDKIVESHKKLISNNFYISRHALERIKERTTLANAGDETIINFVRQLIINSPIAFYDKGNFYFKVANDYELIICKNKVKNNYCVKTFCEPSENGWSFEDKMKIAQEKDGD